MVVVQNKTQTSASSSPLSLAPKKEGQSSQRGLSFSELLHGASAKKDEKAVQNGTLILSLGDAKENVKTLSSSNSSSSTKSNKPESLLSLLGSKQGSAIKESEVKEIKTKQGTIKELKTKESEKTSSSPLSFTSQKDEKAVQNGTLILSLGDTKENVKTLSSSSATKTDKPETLLSLLGSKQGSAIKELKTKESEKTSSSPLSFAAQKDEKDVKVLSSSSATKTDKPETLLSLLGSKQGSAIKELKTKESEKTSSSPLSFAAQKDEKDVKVLSSSSATKTDKPETLLSLLGSKQGNEIKESEKIVLSLNPQVTQNTSASELKVLINDAKQFLKDKIIASEGFQKSEIAALPKTLKGLVQVAQKIGIDVSKVTLQEVKKSAEESSKAQTLVTLTLDDDIKPKTKTTNEAVSIQKDEKAKTPLTQQNNRSQALQQTAEENNQQKVDPKREQAKIQETPLFKAQTKNEISTQEIVTARTAAFELKTPKEKVEDNLKTLLQADKSQKSELGVKSDVLVATPRAIVSPAEPSLAKGLESLLYGQKQEESAVQASKIDGLNVSKADSLEVKVNEAKQMIKYLSADIKTAIEDYKSPFTRVKIQLNPQKLGEVDLTVVQRGKNLHISLSSNNAAINTLAVNANDLKLQLTNSGINNATLNFSNNPQSQDGSASQQQQRNHHQREEARKEYNFFESEEANEEILSSLEIVVPSYA